MKFPDLAVYLEKLENTASRNEMTITLAEIFRRAGEEEIDKISYLLLGKLLPSYRGIEFNMAERMMIRALALAFGETAPGIMRKYKSSGDLGDVAYDLAGQKKKWRDIEVNSLYDVLLGIALDSGTGSQERKIKKMAELLSNLDARSIKFVVRMPLGKMRLGFSDVTLLDAFSTAERGDKSARALIEAAYNVGADIGAIAKKIKSGGLPSLKKIETTPGIPVRPSLAERLPDVLETIEKAGPLVGVEKKLDGFRTQLHVWSEKGKKHISLFSRNLENTTPMFPEIVAAAEKLKVKDVILDGESIGFNPKNGRFTSFQETVQRKRKHGIEEFAKKIPLHIFIFDILHLNGESLVTRTLRERRKILERVLPAHGTGTIILVEHKETDDPHFLEEELKKSVAAGLEGLVAKNLEAPYRAGHRGFHWIKLKATMAALENLRAGKKRGKTQVLDTVDCLIMGAYKGRGKRADFGIGGFLLGIRGPGDKYYTISRLGTGLSDERFREARRRLEGLRATSMPKEYVADKEVAPDIWAKPSIVAEILADEITLSPRHTAGRHSAKGRGYSLRFPRLVRFRDDKGPEDATTLKEIEKLYKMQSR